MATTAPVAAPTSGTVCALCQRSAESKANPLRKCNRKTAEWYQFLRERFTRITCTDQCKRKHVGCRSKYKAYFAAPEYSKLVERQHVQAYPLHVLDAALKLGSKSHKKCIAGVYALIQLWFSDFLKHNPDYSGPRPRFGHGSRESASAAANGPVSYKGKAIPGASTVPEEDVFAGFDVRRGESSGSLGIGVRTRSQGRAERAAAVAAVAASTQEAAAAAAPAAAAAGAAAGAGSGGGAGSMPPHDALAGLTLKPAGAVSGRGLAAAAGGAGAGSHPFGGERRPAPPAVPLVAAAGHPEAPGAHPTTSPGSQMTDPSLNLLMNELFPASSTGDALLFPRLSEVNSFDVEYLTSTPTASASNPPVASTSAAYPASAAAPPTAAAAPPPPAQPAVAPLSAAAPPPISATYDPSNPLNHHHHHHHHPDTPASAAHPMSLGVSSTEAPAMAVAMKTESDEPEAVNVAPPAALAQRISPSSHPSPPAPVTADQLPVFVPPVFNPSTPVAKASPALPPFVVGRDTGVGMGVVHPPLAPAPIPSAATQAPIVTAAAAAAAAAAGAGSGGGIGGGVPSAQAAAGAAGATAASASRATKSGDSGGSGVRAHDVAIASSPAPPPSGVNFAKRRHVVPTPEAVKSTKELEREQQKLFRARLQAIWEGMAPNRVNEIRRCLYQRPFKVRDDTTLRQSMLDLDAANQMFQAVNGHLAAKGLSPLNAAEIEAYASAARTRDPSLLSLSLSFEDLDLTLP